MVGCGGDDDGTQGNLVVTSTFTLTPASGSGATPFDALANQVVSFEIEFANSTDDLLDVEPCTRLVTSADGPPAVASGATAADVKGNILDALDGWEMRLDLCAAPTRSSVSLFSDNERGLGVSLGCLQLPATAEITNSDGDPQWAAMMPGECSGFVYDQFHGHDYSAESLALAISFH